MSHFVTIVFLDPAGLPPDWSTLPDQVDAVMNACQAAARRQGESPPWDGWTIGGRYGAVLERTWHKEEQPATQRWRTSVCWAEDLPVDHVPFAVVTPMGRARSRG